MISNKKRSKVLSLDMMFVEIDCFVELFEIISHANELKNFILPD
jgi:hypothetical protein